MVPKQLTNHDQDLIVEKYRSGEGVEKIFQNISCNMEHWNSRH